AGLFDELHSLQTLLLFVNDLHAQSLPAGLWKGLVSLKTLYLGSNANFGPIPDYFFSGLGSLKQLYFLQSSVEFVSDHTFAGLSSLEELGLDATAMAELSGRPFATLP